MLPSRATTLNIAAGPRGDEVTVDQEEDLCGWLANYIIASFAVTAISLALMLAQPDMVHWFIIPAMVCGVLAGADVVRWLRGLLDPFDLKGLVGLVIFHGFFLAPLLHAFWHTYGLDLRISGDPRYWLGIVASVNAVGLVCFKLSQHWFFHHTAPVRKIWEPSPGRILPILIMAVVVGFCSQAVFNLRLAETARSANPFGEMRGYGWLLMLSDPLPVLILIGILSWSKTHQQDRNYLLVTIILALAAIGQFFWVGLRGSRSATVVGVFWATGLVHYYWRRLRPYHLLLGLLCLLAFMYLYGFYKGLGEKAIGAMDSLEGLAKLEKKTDRTFSGIILGDLARADVQAAIASSLAQHGQNYELRYGRTYLEALARIVPSRIWELLLGGPLFFKEDWSKDKVFVELVEGKGKYDPEYHRASRVFGVSGEAMLNFGLAGIPAAWLFFGSIVGWCRCKIKTLPDGDSRWALVPFLSFLAIQAVVSDMDNLVFGIFTGSLMIFLCILLWSRKGDRGDARETA